MRPFNQLIACIILTSGIGFIGSAQAKAQEGSTGADAVEAVQAFREEVKKNTSAACLKTAPIEDQIEKAIACKCYSDQYVDKYSDSALINIVSWMNENPEKSSIVFHMLEAERKSCKLP